MDSVFEGKIAEKGFDVYTPDLPSGVGHQNYENWEMIMEDNGDYDRVNESMYTNSSTDVKQYCDEIICYYSKNDPYVDYDAEKLFADEIATQQIIIENGGHLNTESGYEEFEELTRWID